VHLKNVAIICYFDLLQILKSINKVKNVMVQMNAFPLLSGWIQLIYRVIAQFYIENEVPVFAAIENFLCDHSIRCSVVSQKLAIIQQLLYKIFEFFSVRKYAWFKNKLQQIFNM
jgi:hypothetical protein